jgi:hypothetical protein
MGRSADSGDSINERDFAWNNSNFYFSNKLYLNVHSPTDNISIQKEGHLQGGHKVVFGHG